jgi:hypothetical protein
MRWNYTASAREMVTQPEKTAIPQVSPLCRPRLPVSALSATFPLHYDWKRESAHRADSARTWSPEPASRSNLSLIRV